MTKGRKTGGRDFKLGNPGKPKGAVTIPKEIKNLNRKKTEEILSRYLGMNEDQLLIAKADPTSTALELATISIIEKCIKFGDFTRLNFILDRTIGKVVDKVDLSNEDGTLKPQSTVIVLPSNDRELKE